MLKCFVLRRDRVRDCEVLREFPRGFGFGEAALKTESRMRVRVHDQTGRRVYDEWVNIRKHFYDRRERSEPHRKTSPTHVISGSGSIEPLKAVDARDF